MRRLHAIAKDGNTQDMQSKYDDTLIWLGMATLSKTKGCIIRYPLEREREKEREKEGE